MSRDLWESYAASWRRHLAARNVSPGTIATYATSLAAFGAWAREQDLDDPTRVKRADVEGFLEQELGRTSRRGLPVSPAHVHKHFRQLRVFFVWLVDIEEIDRSPMAKIPAPKVPETQVPVVPDVDLAKLLKICRGKEFVDRRDTAIIRLLFDAGLRRGELAALTLSRINLDQQTAYVLGKGRKERYAPFGTRTAEALDSYLRARGRHPDSMLEDLWLSVAPHRGPLGYAGVRLMLLRRCKEAGIRPINPHALRHTSVDAALTSGLKEGEAMSVYGWASRAMVDHYAKSNRDRRAVAAARKLSPGDRV